MEKKTKPTFEITLNHIRVQKDLKDSMDLALKKINESYPIPMSFPMFRRYSYNFLCEFIFKGNELPKMDYKL